MRVEPFTGRNGNASDRSMPGPFIRIGPGAQCTCQENVACDGPRAQGGPLWVTMRCVRRGGCCDGTGGPPGCANARGHWPANRIRAAWSYVDSRYDTDLPIRGNCRITAGRTSRIPITVGQTLGTTSNSAEIVSRSRSYPRSGAKSQPAKTEDSIQMPAIAPSVERKNSDHVKPSVTSSIDGEKTKTNGTSALPMPSRKAVLPALKALASAIPAAA